MPLINYLCECGNSNIKFYRRPIDAPSFIVCLKCSKEQKKSLSMPNSRSIVVVDNGVQAKAVEVDLELIKDIESRSTKDFKDK